MMRSGGRPKEGKGKSVVCAVSVTMKGTLAQPDGTLQKVAHNSSCQFNQCFQVKRRNPCFLGKEQQCCLLTSVLQPATDRPAPLAFVLLAPPSLLLGIVLPSSGPLEGTTQGAVQWGPRQPPKHRFCKTAWQKKILFNYVCVCLSTIVFVQQTKPGIQTSQWLHIQQFPISGVRLEIVTTSLFSQGTNSCCAFICVLGFMARKFDIKTNMFHWLYLTILSVVLRAGS